MFPYFTGSRRTVGLSGMTADPNVSIETGAQWKNSFNQLSERFQVTPIGDRADHRAHPESDHERAEGVSSHLGLERVIDCSDPVLEHVIRVLKILLG